MSAIVYRILRPVVPSRGRVPLGTNLSLCSICSSLLCRVGFYQSVEPSFPLLPTWVCPTEAVRRARSRPVLWALARSPICSPTGGRCVFGRRVAGRHCL